MRYWSNYGALPDEMRCGGVGYATEDGRPAHREPISGTFLEAEGPGRVRLDLMRDSELGELLVLRVIHPAGEIAVRINHEAFAASAAWLARQLPHQRERG